MVRGRSLSDANVIRYINDNYVAFDLNCNFGFPPDTPALTPYERFYNAHHEPGQGEGNARGDRFSRGFTKSLVIAPDGATTLNTAGSAAVTPDWRDNPNYNADGYLQFLERGVDNWRRYSNISAWQASR